MGRHVCIYIYTPSLVAARAVEAGFAVPKPQHAFYHIVLILPAAFHCCCHNFWFELVSGLDFQRCPSVFGPLGGSQSILSIAELVRSSRNFKSPLFPSPVPLEGLRYPLHAPLSESLFQVGLQNDSWSVAGRTTDLEDILYNIQKTRFTKFHIEDNNTYYLLYIISLFGLQLSGIPVVLCDLASLTHTQIYIYIFTYIHTYLHTYIHTYIHSYILTYIHT